MKYVRAGLLVGVIGLCAVALTICAYLMGLHSPIKAAGATPLFSNLWADACAGEGEQETGGCEKVVKTSYGSIKLPWLSEITTEQRDAQGNITKELKKQWVSFDVPVAQIGQSYYIFMLVWFLFTGVPQRESRRWHLLPLLLAIGAAAVSVFYIYIMWSVVHEWCKLCLRLHVIDFVLLAAALLLWPRRGRPAALQPEVPAEQLLLGGPPQTVVPATPGSMAGLSFRHALATLACAAVLIGASFRHRHDQQQLANALGEKENWRQQFVREQERPEFLLGAYLTTPVTNVPRRLSEITLGAPTAPHEMIIFSDLQCPACYTFERTLRDQILVGMWKGSMRYTFRHYPLCTACNPYVKNLHPQGCQAAFALEAARILAGQEGFMKMHRHLLDKYLEIQSPGFDPASYEKYAAEIGLDPAAFRSAFQGDEVRRVIEEDIRVARRIGATSTPTVFIDGRRLQSYALQTSNPHFWQALAKEHTAGAQPASSGASQ